MTQIVENVRKQIEVIHNLLWNESGLNPQQSYEHLMFFFAYRLLEDQVDNLGLPKVCKWSYVTSLLDATNANSKVCDSLYDGGCEFQDNPKTRPFFPSVYLIKERKNTDLILAIITNINKLPLKDIEADTLGEIFEYIIGRGASKMQDQGQFFTPRPICNLAFELAYKHRPKLRKDDGTLSTFADFFCGTGGFVSVFVKGVKKYLPDVNWEKDKNSIYASDQDLSSISSTLLNLLILTGISFSSKNIVNGNSFRDDLTKGRKAKFPGLKVDYGFYNPPYGGTGFNYYTGSKKDKSYYVNDDILSIGIEDNDKVSAGVQLAMSTLSDDGICCIVLPQGFFFGSGKNDVEIRRRICEEYKVWYVVDIASGEFTNTGTKTSMLVFQRGVGVTDVVKFLDVDKNVLCECKLEDLKKKKYNLSFNNYLPEKELKLDDCWEMVKLGDIVDINSGKPIKKCDIGIGSYPVVGGGKFIGFTKTSNRHSRETVIPRVGSCQIKFLTEPYYLTDNGFSITSSNSRCDSFFVYLMCQSILSSISLLYDRTGQPVINKTKLNDFKIPLPSIEIQQQIVSEIEPWFNLVQMEEKALKTLEDGVMGQVKAMGRGCEKVELGSVCTLRYGDKNTKHTSQILYPLIGGGISSVRKVQEWNVEPFTTIVARSGTAGYVSRYPTRASVASFAFTLHPTETFDQHFFHYNVKNMEPHFKRISDGTVQKNLNREDLLGVSIPLPPIDQQKTLEPFFNEIKNKHEILKLYKAKLRELIVKYIPGAQQEEQEIESIPDTENEQDDKDLKDMSFEELSRFCEENEIKHDETTKEGLLPIVEKWQTEIYSQENTTKDKKKKVSKKKTSNIEEKSENENSEKKSKSKPKRQKKNEENLEIDFKTPSQEQIEKMTKSQLKKVCDENEIKIKGFQKKTIDEVKKEINELLFNKQ